MALGTTARRDDFGALCPGRFRLRSLSTIGCAGDAAASGLDEIYAAAAHAVSAPGLLRHGRYRRRAAGRVSFEEKRLALGRVSGSAEHRNAVLPGGAIS